MTAALRQNPGTFRITLPWLKVSSHHYDWAPFLNLQRPATHWVRRARVLGLGFDVDWNQCQRVYSVSLGLRRLFNLSWAYQAGSTDDLKLESVIADRDYVQFDLLLFSLMWGARNGVRLFFRDRPLIPKPKPQD